MVVTLFGIVMAVREVQYKNALSPMAVTLVGMVTLVSEVQLLNALLPMAVTLPSFGITLVLHPAISVLDSVSIRQLPAL